MCLHPTASAKTTTYGFAVAQQSSILAESWLHLHQQTAKNLFRLIYLKISFVLFGAASSRSLIADRICTIRVTTPHSAAQIHSRVKRRVWFRAVIATIASPTPARSGVPAQETKWPQTRRIARWLPAEPD